MTNRSVRTGGRILVDSLCAHGVDRLFCVPGESYLDVLDALHDTPQIEVVVAKHEGAAANMAEADAKLTGRPGICFVTRGPGATHASVGVHTAQQGSTPLILFVGQVSRPLRGREAFQEMDHAAFFGPIAKWAAEIPETARIPEYVARAFRIAVSGRPGPVVLSLPEDVLDGESEVVDCAVAPPPAAAPGDPAMASLRRALAGASRPILVLGGSSWSTAAREAIATFARANRLPVALAFRRQDLFDNTDRHYIGHLALGISPPLAQAVRAADLLIVVGSRLDEVTSGKYELIQAPSPSQRLVHVHPDPDQLSRVYAPWLAISAGTEAFARAASTLAPVENPPWTAWLEDLHAKQNAFTEPVALVAEHRGVDLAAVMKYLDDHLEADAIIASGAGNYTVWAHRFFRFRGQRRQLAPTSGAMGYGLPAALAAKRRFPGRTVVCLAGDGCFLMYPQELATAIQHRIEVIVLIINNGMYGTIRMHQERRYPGRAQSTELTNPDFIGLARSFGAYAKRIDRTEDFAAAFDEARRAGVAAVLELRVDPEQVTPSQRIGAVASRSAARPSP